MIPTNDERLRQLLLGQQQLMEEVEGILAEEQRKDDHLSAAVLSSRGDHINHILRPDPDRIFSEKDIQRLCVAYKLRFLDAGRFKGKLPPRALYELRRLEARSPEALQGFKIMAPAKRFKLCDSDADPFLFAPIGPKHYCLVHHWGRHVSPWRLLLVWPWRGPVELGVSVLLMALLIGAAVPNHLLGVGPGMAWWGAHRVLGMVWLTFVLAGFTTFAWFAFFGMFSRRAWRDHRFN